MFGMDTSYWLYMNEAEGFSNIVNTREAILNRIGKSLREQGYAGQVVPQDVLEKTIAKYGQNKVKYDNLSVKDIKTMERWL